MPEGLLIRLRPTGPWRIGPDSGDRGRVDRIYHSDSLYSAVSGAFAQLGLLDEWLDATARAAQTAVRFSSCFPFHGDSLMVSPPRSVWPPPPSTKVRWKGARFVPLSVVESLTQGRPVSEEWIIDGPSECLVPHGAQGPFRPSVRSSAAVDRAGASVAPHSTACLEFTPGSGLWFVAAFSDEAARETWTRRLTAAFRLLADSGFGGERSRGWGRSEMPEIVEGDLPGLLISTADNGGESGYWMLSLFHPGADDAVDWQRGDYTLTTRGGRVDASGDMKKPTRMVAEGSVIVASSSPHGAAPDVAPEEFPHPVYRAGFALAIPIPLVIVSNVAGRPAA
jgi:CRISPR type III-A-associated RAMP protein Csm4